LRAEAGCNPCDWALSGLIRELSTRSEILRSWWVGHNVRFYRTGFRRFHQPVAGDLTWRSRRWTLPRTKISASAPAPQAPAPIPRRAEPPGELGDDARPSRDDLGPDDGLLAGVVVGAAAALDGAGLDDAWLEVVVLELLEQAAINRPIPAAPMAPTI
jgi:MmyB-like transcription regulator ligand binding domain